MLYRISLSACVSLLAIVAGASTVNAQQVAPSTPEALSGGIEDIVVTARRVEESLQDTPISVSALSSRAIAQAGIQTIDRVTTVMPNVAITEASGGIGGTVAFIRGIGAQDPSLALDTAVGTYLDGVYIARPIASNLSILDVERIEVLRGPQGTLFGRNTTGGTINIVTRQPSNDFGVEARFGIASFDEFSARATVDSGEIGGSGISATGTYYHRQRGGYVDNVFARDSDDPGAIDLDAFGAKVRGEWGAFSAVYSFDYSHLRGTNPAFQIRFTSPAIANYYATRASGNLPLFQSGYSDKARLEPLEQIAENEGHSLTLGLDLTDGITLKSISAYRKFSSNFVVSYSPLDLFGPVVGFTTPQSVRPYKQDYYYQYARQYSQELQLSGKFDHATFVAGLYYFDEDTFGNQVGSFSFVLPTGVAANQKSLGVFSVDTKSYAAFGQLSYTPPILGERLEITAGARYTKDSKDAAQIQPLARADIQKFNNFSYMLSLAYHFTDDVLGFAKYSTGYRSGGFNVRATASGQAFFFPSEKAKAWEAGIKSDFFDRRLRFNASLFYTDYNNLQVPIYTNTASGATGFTASAKANFKGFDGEIQIVPFENFRISGGFGYTDAEYSRIFFPNPTTGTITNYASISHFPYLPKWTTNIAADYTLSDTGIGDFAFRANLSTKSKRYFHANNLSNLNPFNDQIASRAFQLVDGRITWTKLPLDSKVEAEVSVFVENAFNTHYPVSGIDFGALGIAGNTYNIPRRFGIDFRIKL